MLDPCSFANPTPLAHADTSRDVLPKGAKNWFCPVLHENGDASCSVGEGVMVYSRGRQPMALGEILSCTLHYSTNL
ncbi:hypothetical protein TNCV_3904751 [Trichonephila clavipes]|nr:hypothetical protein TNCV_3904751 [Trichonephila clavipes]